MGNVRPGDLPRQGKRLMPYCLLPIKNQQHTLVMGISKKAYTKPIRHVV